MRELTLQAANGSTSDAGRQAIKQQIDQLTEEAKSTLNSAYDGRYIFSGTKTDTPPYSAATGDAYQGDASPVVRQIGPGVSVQVNVTGDDVLAGLLPDAAHALGRICAANDTARSSTSDLKAIDAGFDNLTAKRGLIGAVDQPRRRGRHAPGRHGRHHDRVPVQDPGRRPSPGAHRPVRAADGASGRSAWRRRP